MDLFVRLEALDLNFLQNVASMIDFQMGMEFKSMTFAELDRITSDPQVMGGRPCVRGMRVTVSMIVGLVAGSHSNEEILQAYPYLEKEDINQSLLYAAKSRPT